MDAGETRTVREKVRVDLAIRVNEFVIPAGLHFGPGVVHPDEVNVTRGEAYVPGTMRVDVAEISGIEVAGLPSCEAEQEEGEEATADDPGAFHTCPEIDTT